MSSTLAPVPEAHTWSEGFFTPDFDVKQTFRLVIIVALSTFILARTLRGKKTANFPIVNPAQGIELIDKARREHFFANSVELLDKGERENAGKVFKIMTDSGEVAVLPPGMINEIRNDPGLSFTAASQEDFHAHIPGFEPFGTNSTGDELVQGVVRKQLTKFLNKVTKPLSEEANFATELHFGLSQEWQEYSPREELLDIIARISSRVFLGDKVCRNEEWLNITKSYTVSAFMTADSLRQYPNWMRNIVHWFHPGCREIRSQVAAARQIIQPVIEERNRVRYQASRRGLEEPPRFNDAMDWFEEESKGREYDASILQLTLSMVAIETTSDLTTETLLRLAQDPTLVDELREEIATVLKANGWNKNALFHMKLLDSVIKETQRLKPVNTAAMTRKAIRDVKLSNGETIPKGTRTVCSMALMRTKEGYADPEKFDGHRFVDWRGTEKDTQSHLVSTGPASLGFGHGQHACPGRFFAANEIKVALCHLLMKYDWSLPPGAQTEAAAYGFRLVTNPMAKVLVRRRPNIEFDIDHIE